MPPNYQSFKISFEVVTSYEITVEAVDGNYALDYFYDFSSVKDAIENSKQVGTPEYIDESVKLTQVYK